MVARTVAAREASIAREAAARWREREPDREAKDEAVENKEYTKADTPERLAARMRRLGEWIEAAGDARGMPADALRESRAAASLRPEDVTDALVERTIGKSRDLLSVEFFEQGLDAARCVGRVVTRGEANGTGFLVAPGLMLTNQHVLRTAAEAADSEFELDYEEQRFGPRKISQIFKLQPDRFFLSHEKLDFALVAVSPRSGDGASLDDYGFRPLIAEEGKITVGECVNIVQHPEGREKQIVIRENKLVDLPDRPGMEQYFHYRADTEKGSSGSPVFNDQWEIVALHHSGVPKVNARGEIVDADDRPIRTSELEARAVWVANEGVRVSRIVRAIREASLRTTSEAAIRDDALKVWGRQGTPSAQENAVTVRVDTTRKQEDAASLTRDLGPQSARGASPSPSRRPRDDADTPAETNGYRRPTVRSRPVPGDERDGSVELTLPLLISVSFDRSAPGPRVQGSVEASNGANGHDLLERVQPDPDYRERPGFDTGFLGFEVPLPTLADERHGPLAAFGRGGEAELRYYHFSVLMNERRRLAYVAAVNVDAAAPFHHERESGADAWFFDPRLPRRDQAGDEYYKANPLDRGHLVRRDDAAWGATEEEARLANDDTFHFTNCSPQHEIYNQSGKASARGLLLWGNLERAVSKAARRSGGKISVLNGPIFSDDDRPHRRDFFVPAEFWKVIVVRADDGEPRALAFRLSQAEQIADLARERRRRPDDDDLAAYGPFQVRLADLEDATGLDFGPLKDWDPLDRRASARESAGRGGGTVRRITSEREIRL